MSILGFSSNLYISKHYFVIQAFFLSSECIFHNAIIPLKEPPDTFVVIVNSKIHSDAQLKHDFINRCFHLSLSYCLLSTERDSSDDKTWRCHAQISLWGSSFLRGSLIADTWKDCRKQCESSFNSKRHVFFFFQFYFCHAGARWSSEKESEWVFLMCHLREKWD